jgi:D-alanine transaminase
MSNLPNLPLVYLNGEFLPPERAMVSAFDRGFIFGDGVYEVIPVFGRRLFRLPHHLSRLDASLKEIRLPNPLSYVQWQDIFNRLIQANGHADQSVYLQVTRGVAPRDHAFPPKTTPTVFAYAQPLKYSPAADIENGVAAITASDLRWSRCDIKAIALLANALLRQEAIDQGTAEAILLREGFVTEGAASNIFIVKNGELLTPPKGPFILPGITRDLVLELARTNRIPCAERVISEAELFAADEVWLTSSTKEILPITRLNGRTVGSGKPGALHARLLALYRDYKLAFSKGADGPSLDHAPSFQSN